MRSRVFAGTVGVCVLSLGLLAASRLAQQDRQLQKVGQKIGDETLVATGQQVVEPPQTLTYGARPVDMVVSKDGRYAYVKDTSGLTVIDLDGLKVAGQTKVAAGESLCGLALSPDGGTLAFSDAGSGIELFKVAGSEVPWVIRFRSPVGG